MTRKVNVNTTDYEFTWGRKPRGRGYWFFYCFCDDGQFNLEFPNMTYAEARRQAVDFARSHNGYEVKLGS